MNPEILEKTAMSIPEVKKELKAIQKRDEELNFRSQRTLDYANEFSKLKDKETKELIKKLEELEIPRLKDIHIKKIVDLMPVNDKQLKVIFSSYTITVNSDNIKKIMGVVQEYL